MTVFACVIGGDPIGPPCAIIHDGLVEAWAIDEAEGAVAAGYTGEVDLALTAWTPGEEDNAWHVAGSGDDDSGRGFFGGFGVADLAAAVPEGLLSTIGSGVTIAVRRWHTGLDHVVSRVPPPYVGFGNVDFEYFRLEAPLGGVQPPRLLAHPTVSGGVVTPGPVFRFGGPVGAQERYPLPGSQAPGCPGTWPPTPQPRPYLVVITAVVVGPKRITFSVFTHNGVSASGAVCLTTDGDSTHTHTGSVVPPTGTGYTVANSAPIAFPDTVVTHYTETPRGTPVGGVAQSNYALDGGVGELLEAPSGFGALTRIVIGGASCQDTIHQAAVWSRAISPAEVAFLGDNIDKLLTSIDEPGSLCGAGGCTQVAGPGSDNPLLTTGGATAIKPNVIRRSDDLGVISSSAEQGTGQLREARQVHECKARVYELVWTPEQGCGGDEVELIRQALERTRGGCLPTRWRHPEDDGIGGTGTTICDAPRWLIVNARDAGIVLERLAGGHAAGLTLVLREVV